MLFDLTNERINLIGLKSNCLLSFRRKAIRQRVGRGKEKKEGWHEGGMQGRREGEQELLDQQSELGTALDTLFYSIHLFLTSLKRHEH